MLPASLSPHKVSRTGKVLEKLPKKKKNGKKSELNRQKVEGVAKLEMSTPNSNQSKAERFGDHFCEKGIVVAWNLTPWIGTEKMFCIRPQKL